MALKAKIVQKIYLTPTVLLCRMALEQELSFRPGQYITLKIPADGEHMDRPFSIASSARKPTHIDIVVRMVRGGVASTFLENCRVGEELEFEGPEGSFGVQEGTEPLVLIASGTGIAPFRSMLPSLLNEGKKRNITLFFTVSTKKELFFERELQGLATSHKNFQYVPIVSNPHHLSYFRNVQIRPGTQFYVCGGFHFVNDITKLLKERGVEKKRVHLEEFK